jgi:hypothetical protein
MTDLNATQQAHLPYMISTRINDGRNHQPLRIDDHPCNCETFLTCALTKKYGQIYHEKQYCNAHL